MTKVRRNQDQYFSLGRTAFLHVNICLMSVLSRTRKCAFVTSTCSKGDNGRPNLVSIGVKVVKVGSVFFFLRLVVRIAFNPVILSYFALVYFFHFCLLPLFFKCNELKDLLLFKYIKCGFNRSLDGTLLLTGEFTFLGRYLFGKEGLLCRDVCLIRRSIIIVSWSLSLFLRWLCSLVLFRNVGVWGVGRLTGWAK